MARFDTVRERLVRDELAARAAREPLLDEIRHLREQLEAADKRNGELAAENAVLKDRIEQGWRSSPTREICSECAKLSAVGFHVPDRIWAAAIPSPRREDIFCLQCFSRLADRAYVAWDREIAFYPVSKRTHREIVQGADREMVERIAVLEGEIREYERSMESANLEIRRLREELADYKGDGYLDSQLEGL